MTEQERTRRELAPGIVSGSPAQWGPLQDPDWGREAGTGKAPSPPSKFWSGNVISILATFSLNRPLVKMSVRLFVFFVFCPLRQRPKSRELETSGQKRVAKIAKLNFLCLNFLSFFWLSFLDWWIVGELDGWHVSGDRWNQNNYFFSIGVIVRTSWEISFSICGIFLK